MSAFRARLRLEDCGASAVEYSLMVAAVAAVIVSVVFVLGTVVQGAFQRTCDTIAASPAGDGGSCPVPGGTGGDATGGQDPAPVVP